MMSKMTLIGKLGFSLLIVLSLDGCVFDSDPKVVQEERVVNWGLKLQIGNDVVDSILPPVGWDPNTDYDVFMTNICAIEPACATVPRKGKIYGWDPVCFDGIEYNSMIGGGGVISVDSLTGEFDFTNMNISYQGGITYKLWPRDNPRNTKYFCYRRPAFSMAVHFSLYSI